MAKADPHLEDEHIAPARTTPQGTQENGVEFGHEERDTSIRELLVWFGGLIGFMLVVVIALWGVYSVWQNSVRQAEELPSPLFGVRPVPPEPRVLPNPADQAANPTEVLVGPWDTLVPERARMQEEAARLGLTREDGMPALPPGAVAAAMRGTTPPPGVPGAGQPGVPGAGQPGAMGAEPAGGVSEPMPSESSGGMVSEDRLH